MDLSAFFETQLKQALKHFHDLEWLESSSPLTSYYFLGPFLPTIGQGKEVQSPGQVLQQVIQQAAEQLWSQPAKTEPIPRSYEQFQRAIEQAQQQPESTRWVYVLLELRCFQRYIKPKRLADIWEIYLPGSRAEHYRDYDNAIAQLADQLLKQLQPTFRLETVATSQQVIGVEAQITQCIATMNARQSLCLHGPGGVGKSTLAAAAIEQGQFDGCFWFTIRPTLNDHLNSLLFMLGYFLHRQGASGLWQMLLFNAGKLDDLSLALSVTLADLNQLAHRRIVLCFDELELLQITDPERALATHSQILRFIEGLQGQAALLLISQRPTFHADRYIALTGLATPQIRHLLQPVGIELTDSELQQIYHHTNGNLRLLLVVRSLLQRGVALSTLLDSAEQTLTLLPLVHRLLPRLAPAERRILQQLAVFRSPAPIDHWHGQNAAISALVDQRLLQRDGQGGIVLLPALRWAIHDDLSPDLCARLHRDAAQIRATYGEYTAATYHLWQGGDENGALQLWYLHRQQEIARGQANAAYAIFGNLERYRLKPAQRKGLDLIRAELLQFQGKVKQGLAILETEDWSETAEIALQAKLLQGRFLDELGHPHAALDTYAAGEATILRLLDQLTNFHFRAGMVQLRQKENSAAWQALQRAEYAINALRGNLLDQQGDYPAAHAAYTAALVQAESLDLPAERARIHRFLSALYGRQGRMATAIEQAESAAAIYKAHGDLLNLHIVYSNLSAIQLGMQQFDEVLAIGTEALAFFEEMGNSHFVATTAANLAEASYELGDLAQAISYAHRVLDQEEPYAYPYAHYTLGLVRQAEDELAVAEQHLIESAKFARQCEDFYMEAYARRALGVLYRAQRNDTQAESSFMVALQLFEQLGIERECQATAALLSADRARHDQ